MLKWERDAVEECVRALSAVPSVEDTQGLPALRDFARRMQMVRSYVTATLLALVQNDEETVKWGLANLQAHVLNSPAAGAP